MPRSSVREEIDAAVPRTNAACNVRSLPLTPAEGFVLSRIDGHANLRDIGASTGLGDKVRDIVARLVQLGAVHRVAGLGISRPEPAPVAAGPVTSGPQGGAHANGGGQSASGSTPSGRPSPSTAPSPAKTTPDVTRAVPDIAFDQALLDEVCDLDLEAKKRILRLSERLAAMTHYEVLDVPRAASKKEIKSAYYRLAPEFHPDRWFRRELGSFKSRVEAVFVRVTEAQDVLSSKPRRAAYDESLPPEEEASDNASEAGGPELGELTFGEAEPLQAAPSGPPGGPSPAFDLVSDDFGVEMAPAPAPPRDRTLEDAQRRRAALAARLRGGRPTPATTVAPEDVRQPPAEAPRDALKRRYEEAREANDRGQVARFVEVAELAASRNDPVSAANAYRLAAKMAPDDPALAELVATWSHKAMVAMAETYLAQGELDERNGRTADAAQAYLRATVGMPRSAVVHDRAASLLLLSGGDTRKAVAAARRAVELTPTNPAYRLTLAEAYIAAKLFVTARSELEHVLASDPSNERAKLLLKQAPR